MKETEQQDHKQATNIDCFLIRVCSSIWHFPTHTYTHTSLWNTEIPALQSPSANHSHCLLWLTACLSSVSLLMAHMRWRERFQSTELQSGFHTVLLLFPSVVLSYSLWRALWGIYREVEGSFFTRLWARNEDSMGLSSGVGWELFRAE